MSNLFIGLLMMGGIFFVIGLIFYKASPLPEPDQTKTAQDYSASG